MEWEIEARETCDDEDDVFLPDDEDYFDGHVCPETVCFGDWLSPSR